MQISLFSLLHLRLEGLELNSGARFPEASSLQQLEEALFRLCWPPELFRGPVGLKAPEWSRAVYLGDGSGYGCCLGNACGTHMEHEFVQ